MTDHLTIAIPMAGFGSRLRPHTWSRPKPLISIAGKTVLDYVMDLFDTLPDRDNAEYVFIVGYLGDQIMDYVRQNYPQLKAHFVQQQEMRGQSDALYLAREYLEGPTLMVFSDTLVETDFSFLSSETSDIITWVKEVEDPRRFGVAQVNGDSRVIRLIEKPQSMENRLAVVGFYYFRRGKDLISAIEEQMQRDLKLKGEYFLADAVNLMLDQGAVMRTRCVDTWLDAGTPETILGTNRYLLDHGRDNSGTVPCTQNVTIIPPVYIHPEAQISGSVIGPYASIGSGCQIESSVIRNSIIDDSSQVRDIVLEGSVLGRNVMVSGRPTCLNLGDQSWLTQGD